MITIAEALGSVPVLLWGYAAMAAAVCLGAAVLARDSARLLFVAGPPPARVLRQRHHAAALARATLWLIAGLLASVAAALAITSAVLPSV